MSRIVLKQQSKGVFFIQDILDGKKLGKICVSAKLNKIKYSIKSRYKNKHIETEALLLLDCSLPVAFNKLYKSYLKDYNQKWFNTDNYSLPIFVDACRLTAGEADFFNRKTLMHPKVAKVWLKMKAKANKDGVDIQVISAYRSMAYQEKLIHAKIVKGIDIQNILTVNTLPGFSEHHTGCALDIGSQGAEILEQGFDQSDAFQWLVEFAGEFNFFLTYPKDNKNGIMYEPWHWCYRKTHSI